MEVDDSDLTIEALNSSRGDAGPSDAFDNYRSVGDPSLMIFVKTGAVPPFRFKAGGWELLRSSIDLGTAMKARIAEKGYFMFRANEDQTGGVELSDPQTPFAELEPKAEGK
jgi:hypothetical protein